MAIDSFEYEPDIYSADEWWNGSLRVKDDAVALLHERIGTRTIRSLPPHERLGEIGNALISRARINDYYTIQRKESSLPEQVVCNMRNHNCVSAGQAIARFALEAELPYIVAVTSGHVSGFMVEEDAVLRVDNFDRSVGLVNDYRDCDEYPDRIEEKSREVVRILLENSSLCSGAVVIRKEGNEAGNYEVVVSEAPVRMLCEEMLAKPDEVTICEVLAPGLHGLKMARAIAFGKKETLRSLDNTDIEHIAPHQPRFMRTSAMH